MYDIIRVEENIVKEYKHIVKLIGYKKNIMLKNAYVIEIT